MAPAASSNSEASGLQIFNEASVPVAPDKKLKRKREDADDVTGGGDTEKPTGEKKSRATAGAKKNRSRKAVLASDGQRSRKKVKPNNAIPITPPVFECSTCHETFEDITDLFNHDIIHKQQRQQQQQQPRPIRCRKCRQTFINNAERDHHYQTSPRHFCCRYCTHPIVAFTSAASLCHHYIDRHQELYCHFCDRQFDTPALRHAHIEARHRPCNICCKMFPMPELRYNCCRQCHPGTDDGLPPERKRVDGNTVPDHYAVLGVSPYADFDQIVKAAKEMRVKVHPDRRKRAAGVLSEEELRAIDEEAARVGMAADILSDPELRLQYDFKVFV